MTSTLSVTLMCLFLCMVVVCDSVHDMEVVIQRAKNKLASKKTSQSYETLELPNINGYNIEGYSMLPISTDTIMYKKISPIIKHNLRKQFQCNNPELYTESSMSGFEMGIMDPSTEEKFCDAMPQYFCNTTRNKNPKPQPASGTLDWVISMDKLAEYFTYGVCFSGMCGYEIDAYISHEQYRKVDIEYDTDFLVCLDIIKSDPNNERLYTLFLNAYGLEIISDIQYGGVSVRGYYDAHNLNTKLKLENTKIFKLGGKPDLRLPDDEWISSIYTDPIPVLFNMFSMSDFIEASGLVERNIYNRMRWFRGLLYNKRKMKMPLVYQDTPWGKPYKHFYDLKQGLLQEGKCDCHYVSKYLNRKITTRWIVSPHFERCYIFNNRDSTCKQSTAQKEYLGVIGTITSEPIDAFTQPIYAFKSYFPGAEETVLTVSEDEAKKFGEYSIIGYCSPTYKPNMVKLYRYYKDIYGHVFSTGRQDNMELEFDMCWIYPELSLNDVICT